MKKLFYLLMMLPLAFMVSCSDDDDLPEVDLTLTLTGVTQYDNSFYAVKAVEEETPETSESTDGELRKGVIRVDGLTAKSLTDQNATVANAIYYLDGFAIPPTLDYPFVCEFTTSNLVVGTHTISVTASVLQVDKTLASAALNFPLKIVASEEDLPEGAPEIGTYSMTARMQAK